MVTGASGFIGRSVVLVALSRGHQVTAITRSKEKTAAVLPVDHACLSIVELSDDFNFPSDIDALIHLAWADVGDYNSPEIFFPNVIASVNFITAAMAAGIDNIAVAGSCLEYGLKEGSIKESEYTDPVTYYGLAKTTIFNILRLIDNKSVTVNWLRFFYVYGIGQRSNSLLGQIVESVSQGKSVFDMSKGDQVRDFIHVDILALNTVLIVESRSQVGVINVGSGYPRTVVSFVRDVLVLLNSEMGLNRGHYSYPRYEPFSFYADVGKLECIKNAVITNEIYL